VNLAASNGLYLVLLLLSGIVVPLTSLRRSSGVVAVALPPGAMAKVFTGCWTGSHADRHDWLYLGSGAARTSSRRTFRFD